MDFLFANKDVFMINLTDYNQYRAEEDARKEQLRGILKQLSSAKSNLDELDTFGNSGKPNLAADDEKENFLMPAPRGRPPRNRTRNTKDALDSVRMSKSSRLTRASRNNESLVLEETTVAKKGRKTKSTVKESLMITQDRSSIEVLDNAEISADHRKSRRTTRKVKENPVPRISTRATRASTRASTTTTATRVSMHPSTTTGTRASTRKLSKRKSSILEPKSTPGPKRLRSSRAINASTLEIDEPQHIPAPLTTKKNKTKVSQVELFSPYGKKPVKERVEAFEGLSSIHDVKEDKTNKTLKVTSPVKMINSAPLITVMSPSTESVKRVGSPLVKSKNQKCQPKIDVVVAAVKEEPEQDESSMEYQEGEQCKEVSGSPFLIEEDCAREESGNAVTLIPDKVPPKKNKGKKTPEDDEGEADDEWMTDDESSKTPKNKLREKSGSPYSGTPKGKAGSSKVSQDTVGSYKALRSRKVKKASDVSLTLSAKAKTPKVASLLKLEIDNEAEVKRLKEEERQKEALKRKEELLKKRTEVTKKKREDKMMKVKRTREEREKERVVKKHKTAKALEEKKKKAAMAAEEPEPVKVATPVKIVQQDLNSTYGIPAKEANSDETYNMTPHWQDVPPKQPDNPNDFGVVDNTDCSSEEEADPRKKIPKWAQIKSNDKELLTQCILSARLINKFWLAKPRAPTIKEFFGTHVSSKTLRRGMNHRTSSAVWDTPPLRN